MKKFFSVIMLLVAVCISASAAKATGEPMKTFQPDGTILMYRLLGDEWKHWYQTMDGVLLVNEGGTFYVAKTNADGSLVSTGIIAHNIDTRSDIEAQMAKEQNPNQFFSRISDDVYKPVSRGSGFPLARRCPHNGKVKIPVILMEYPDLKFTKQGAELKAQFGEYFNSTETSPFSTTNKKYLAGYGSVKQYFLDASNGLFEPEFELYGPYTISQKHDTNTDKYGYSQRDEVLEIARKDIDFSKYDSDNDGNVDLVYILYAGSGQNLSSNTHDVWPHCTPVNKGPYNGKVINTIGLSNELVYIPDGKGGKNAYRSGIGVLCHEMSHGLGLPDLYWQTNDSRYTDNCGPEEWDLMDGGENLYGGIWPVQYNAWEKESMGWLSFEELTEPQDVTIYALDNKEGKGKVYVVRNPANKNEYYVIENFMCSNDHWNYYHWRHNLGLDITVPGLLITHINGYDGYAPSLNINVNTNGKPRITLLPADEFILGYYSVGTTKMYQGKKQEITSDMYYDDEATDVYPGPNGVTAITAYKNYDGEEMVEKYPITDITVNSDRSISFKFKGGGLPSGINELITDADNSIYTIGGVFAGNDFNALPMGIYIRNGKKVVKK